MLTEDYVSFEIAKLLKEKGFDESTELCFVGEEWESTSLLTNSQLSDGRYSRPTLQMTMKWLREKYECVVLFDVSAWGSYDWYYVYRGNRYHYEEMTFNYNGLEDAAEAAIKYCLENLI